MSAPYTAVLRYGGAAALVLGLVVLVSRLALAPVQGVHNAAECRSAYVRAQTRSDSNAVDFLSFPDPAGRHITRRCNEVLPAAVGAPGR
jgi:hypothetical protein